MAARIWASRCAIFLEARKFAAHFCLANQYTQQVPELVRAAILGNAG
jgi:hypothetical protein